MALRRRVCCYTTTDMKVCSNFVCLCVSCSVCAENKALFWFSRHISLWGSISFYLACLVNIAVAVFYPFGDDGDEGENFYFSDTKIQYICLLN